MTPPEASLVRLAAPATGPASFLSCSLDRTSAPQSEALAVPTEARATPTEVRATSPNFVSACPASRGGGGWDKQHGVSVERRRLLARTREAVARGLLASNLWHSASHAQHARPMLQARAPSERTHAARGAPSHWPGLRAAQCPHVTAGVAAQWPVQPPAFPQSSQHIVIQAAPPVIDASSNGAIKASHM